jgi:5-methylcytosine-specific restriction endonuclease McrA
MRTRKWTSDDLKKAVNSSKSIRQTISKLGLIEAGGNYVQVKKYIELYKINTDHFNDQPWNKGLKIFKKPVISLEDILKKNSDFQSFKLKKRLYQAGLKKPECEECGWKKIAEDGRMPLELDHVNGDHKDNRLCNLRILCPNCHSLKSTHRGRNRRK